jgi:hypothetical protein
MFVRIFGRKSSPPCHKPEESVDLTFQMSERDLQNMKENGKRSSKDDQTKSYIKRHADHENVHLRENAGHDSQRHGGQEKSHHYRCCQTHSDYENIGRTLDKKMYNFPVQMPPTQRDNPETVDDGADKEMMNVERKKKQGGKKCLDDRHDLGLDAPGWIYDG